MNVLQAVLLLAWALAGTLVVAEREPLRQIALVGIMGLLASLAFFSLQAPDVALSMLVVGAVALPTMLLLALGRIRVQEEEGRGEDGEERR